MTAAEFFRNSSGWWRRGLGFGEAERSEGWVGWVAGAEGCAKPSQGFHYNAERLERTSRA
jgi:hypothetical protein